MGEREQARPCGYGLIGCGSFGRFCLEQYRSSDLVRIVAVADANADAARSTAEAFGVEACSPEELVGREDIELVHIATPPSTHAQLALAALGRGRNVLSEKPLAASLYDAEEVVRAARMEQRVLAVNQMMPYNALAQAAHVILEEQLLGLPIHGFFENYAQDELLPQKHWFWSAGDSGGIFIEHAVHFFDLFGWWLGPGEVLAAQAGLRPGTENLVEHVQAQVRHQTGVLVNHYHGFHQAKRMDRQEFRLVCERGDLRLHGWVPLAAEIDALLDDAALARMRAILPGADVESIEAYAQGEEIVSRHKRYRVAGRYRISSRIDVPKDELYGRMLRELLEDQVRAIRDPRHVRRVTEQNGLDSLRTAVEATALTRT